MKTLTETFSSNIKMAERRTRTPNVVLVESRRTIKDWKKLSDDCVNTFGENMS